MNKKELILTFKYLSDNGSLMGIACEAYDGFPESNLIVDSYEILHYEESHFWLLFRFMEYHYGEREIRKIKVVNITKDNDRYLLNVLIDDDKYLYLIEPLTDEIKKSEKWEEWLELKEKYKDLFKQIDEYSFKRHQMAVLNDNESHKYQWKFIKAREALWKKIRG